MRPTSDINLMLARAFDVARIDALSGPLRLATAGLHLAPMLILEEEIELAAAAFAMKFMDIGRRHRVLFGDDPSRRSPSRARRRSRASARCSSTCCFV